MNFINGIIPKARYLVINNKPKIMPITIKYSSPAKILFSGEYSVVHGQPALAMSLDYRLTFSLYETDGVLDELDKGIPEAIEVVKKYLTENKIDFAERGFEYEISSEIPIGQGFGSSAAFSSATVAAFYEFFSGKQPSKEVINDLAYEVEVLFHGKPSGVDPAAVTFGGLLFFRKEFEYLKTISSLPFGINKDWLDRFYVVHSGDAVETTKELVEMVASKKEADPEYYNSVFAKMGQATKDIIKAFQDSNQELLMSAIQTNQDLLDQIGVVSDNARSIISSLSPFGPAKITGAGGNREGSGYILFFLNGDKSELEDYLNQSGLKYLKATAENDGVKSL